jgi:hypothetical protein
MTQTQRAFKLTLPRTPGQPRHDWQNATFALNHPPGKISREKLLADLLKRICTSAMAAVTECEPHTIPAHLARLKDLSEILRFVLRKEMVPGADTLRSGKQLLYAATLADFVEALEITAGQHRAPAFVTARDEQLETINRKLDTLAGLFAQSPALQAVLNEEVES